MNDLQGYYRNIECTYSLGNFDDFLNIFLVIGLLFKLMYTNYTKGCFTKPIKQIVINTLIIIVNVYHFESFDQ